MNEELAKKYMPVVRGMIKMSSALNEADEVMHGKYYKFEFKRKFREWMEFFEIASEKFVTEFMMDNAEALQDAYTHFLEFTKDINVKDSERTDLILLYCKLKSAHNDLSESDEDGMMVYVVKSLTGKVLTAIEKQYADIFNVRDVDNKSIQVIIDQYDELGKTMFVNQ